MNAREIIEAETPKGVFKQATSMSIHPKRSALSSEAGAVKINALAHFLGLHANEVEEAYAVWLSSQSLHGFRKNYLDYFIKKLRSGEWKIVDFRVVIPERPWWKFWKPRGGTVGARPGSL